MALTDEGGMGTTMLVQPSGGYPYPVFNGGFNGNNNGFGGDWAWIILLLLLGWGNNGFGGGYGGGSDIYPWMNQAEITSGGFRDQMMNGNITSIRDSIGNLSTQVCNGFGDVQMALANGFAGVEMGANARQMANMQQGFALQSQLADCCCENRLGTADLKYTIATENCQDRYEAQNNTRDIIDSQTRGTQAIIDKLCALELDNKNTRIADLERQLTMADLRASQIAQTAEIQRGQVGEVDALYQRLKDCPVPTQPVYGSQPIFTCPQNSGCGCGCGGNF